MKGMITIFCWPFSGYLINAVELEADPTANNLVNDSDTFFFNLSSNFVSGVSKDVEEGEERRRRRNEMRMDG